jgi:hypothetical protein
VPMSGSQSTLRLIKILHTIVWFVFASSIVLIPVFAVFGRLGVSAWLIGLVLIEVAVLAINGMRCPLTDVAARYTSERRDNFDIYLPLWLARHNKTIFWSLYVAGLVYTLLKWTHLLE